MKTLRDRCQEFLSRPYERGTHTDALMAFVIAETGRTADPKLDQNAPLCLYFPSAKDRDDFVRLIQQVRPEMVTRKLP